MTGLNTMTTARPPSDTAPHIGTVLYVDGCTTIGGAPLALANVLPHMRGVRPVIQHALPPQLAHIFVPWDAVYAEFWDPHTRLTPADRPPRPWVDRVPYGGAVRAMIGAVLPAAKRIVGLARRWDARIIHGNNHLGGHLPALLAARWLGIPCVIHQRVVEPQSRLVHTFAGWATRYVAASRFIADQLTDWGVRPEKIVVIYDGVDLGTMCQPRPPGPEVVVGIVARFVPLKGMHVAVEAACRVVAARPHVRFVFVGGPVPEAADYFPQVCDRARSSPHAHRLEFVGEQAEGWRLMREMDVFLQTSVQPEAGGLVLAEAMAAGCAVVAPNHGGPVDICEDGAGLLLPPGDVDALTSAVLRLVDHAEERAALQARGQARLRERFDVRHTARQWEALYETCLNER